MIRAKQKTNKKLRPSANTRTYDLRKREINLNNGLTSNELKRKTLNNSQFFVFKEKCNRGRTLWPFVGNVKSRCFHADPTRFELTEREPHAAQWGKWQRCLTLSATLYRFSLANQVQCSREHKTFVQRNASKNMPPRVQLRHSEDWYFDSLQICARNTIQQPADPPNCSDTYCPFRPKRQAVH